MKDNFSSQSQQYSVYRPHYPTELFQFINDLVPSKINAWDAGTGNGQIAAQLSKTFDQVFATDISEAQLANAQQADNIIYSIQRSENVNFSDNFFDVVTVGQAIHWFDFEKFYAEVKRTAKPDAAIVIAGYGAVMVNDEIDTLKKYFHSTIIGNYWDYERKFVDENYQTIPFPFKEIAAPRMANELHWSLHQYIGYIQTWSAVKKYEQQHKVNPVTAFAQQLQHLWPEDEVKKVSFPIFVRAGWIHR